ncbi:MAG: cation-transporting P-type ATPase [Candidatus Sumerlaeia bacterium]|nr:cation-transporting P-type ATPase [Candidatus Sumerlaeia bacterium]
METLVGRHWHCIPNEQVLDLLETNAAKGLDRFEVKRRQEHFGPNVLTPKRGKGPLLRFLLQFHQPLVYILLVAGTITLLLHEYVDAGVIFGVVLVNAIVGFIQESKAVKAIEALARTMTSEARVLRSGEKRLVSAAELVPGDIVFLQSGDKVPADLRLLDVRDLQTDESALTGESVPVSKKADVMEHDTLLADRRNMAYASALVTYGQAMGVVVATGDRTEVGRISQMISEAQELQTPLTRKIAQFSHLLLYVILGLAGVTFAVGVARGEKAGEMFMAAVALAVGAIPEGLPAAVTITLAIGVSRMARRRAIVRKLPAVETLGSTTVICSDKTGTLTENQMTVRDIRAGGQRFEVSGAGYAPEGEIQKDGQTVRRGDAPALEACLLAGLLCNDSRWVESEGRWQIEGDPTEGCLIVAASKAGLAADTALAQYPRVDSIPFESQHQYMATLHKTADGQRGVIFFKGAVETTLSRCSSALDAAGRTVALDAAALQAEAESMARQGLRVLAFAWKEAPAGQTRLTPADVDSDLIFLGLQGMIDPPRAEAIAAVDLCHKAGIRVKMITGDHVLTAKAIARQLHLGQQEPNGAGEPPALSGRELAEVSDTDLPAVAERTAVFARVTPEQKLRLVEALQSREHVVAMTGDGVNDAPALKRADIGIAMGVTGTEVAKEASDMVLTDDNFASIAAAVEEGRGVFDNLTKFIVWTLPTNVGEGLVILAAVFAGVAMPILPVQILWINMTTAVLLGLMLAFEPKEPGIMERPPRDPRTPILTGYLIFRILLVGFLLLLCGFGLYEWEERSGTPTAQARTVAVNVFVMVELFYLFNCRTLKRPAVRLGRFSNPWLFGGAALMILLQLAQTYLPLMNHIFHTAPINGWAWVRILVSALAVYIIVDIEKRWRAAHARSKAASI